MCVGPTGGPHGRPEARRGGRADPAASRARLRPGRGGADARGVRGPAPTSTCCWARLPAPPGHRGRAGRYGRAGWHRAGRRRCGPGRSGRVPGCRTQAGAVPAGFAGRITLTIPLATLLGLADRPAEIPGIGPIDPDPGANTPDRYQTGHQPTAGIQHINVPDRCLRRVGNWCASRPLTCGSNRLIDDRQVRAYVGGLPVFAVDRICVRAPMSADERQSADALGRLEAVSLYE